MSSGAAALFRRRAGTMGWAELNNGDINVNIWKVLQECAIEHNGKTIETSLLGKVLPIKTDSGELTGFIPPALQKKARQYGLVIEAALYKEGLYVLRTLTHNVI